MALERWWDEKGKKVVTGGERVAITNQRVCWGKWSREDKTCSFSQHITIYNTHSSLSNCVFCWHFVTLTLKQIMGDRRTGKFSSIFPRTATSSWLRKSKHIASVLLTVIKNTFRLRVFGNELYHAAVSETMFPNGKISCAFKLLEEISGGLGNFQGRSLNLVRFPNRNAFEISMSGPVY